MKLLADANIGLRILVGDKDIKSIDESQRKAKMVEMISQTRDIAEKVESGILTLVFTDSVVEEMIFVMDKVYRVPRNLVSELILGLIESDGVESDETMMSALRIYAKTNLDIVDIKLSIQSKERDTPILTWDHDFKKLNCEYISPSELNRQIDNRG